MFSLLLTQQRVATFQIRRICHLKNKTKIYLSYISLAKHKILNAEKVSLKQKPQNFQIYIFKNHLYQLHGLFTFKEQLVVQEPVFSTHFWHHLVFGYDQIEYYIIEALTGTPLVLPQSHKASSLLFHGWFVFCCWLERHVVESPSIKTRKIQLQ